MLTVLVGLIAVVICVAANAFFVAAEFALVTVRHTWVEETAKSGKAAALHVRDAVAKLDDSIATTQLGITLASIALGWLGEPAIAKLIEPLIAPVMPTFHTAAAHTFATVVAFAVITFLHVVLGELAPKAVALGSAEKVALRVAGPLLMFRKFCSPVVWGMNAVGNLIVRKLGFEPAGGHERSHSVGELKILVGETQDAGDLDPTQAEVVERALEFTDKRIRDVMVPLDSVIALEETMSDEQVLARIYSSQHTRLPVYSQHKKKFVGIANAKLLMLQHLRNGRVDLAGAMYKPVIFHHAAPLPRVLRTFKLRRQHMAFVAGDDGAKLGIVTLEDVLEELVGDINDELDVISHEDEEESEEAGALVREPAFAV